MNHGQANGTIKLVWLLAHLKVINRQEARKVITEVRNRYAAFEKASAEAIITRRY